MLGRSALLGASGVNPYGNWTGNYSDVSLLLRNGGPGPLVPFDESPTPKTITVFGNASVTTAIAKWNQGSGGSSLAFDGDGDYITIPKSADFDFGTGSFTVEAWCRFGNTGVDVGIVSGIGPSNGTLAFRLFSDNTLRIGRNHLAWDLISSVLTWSTGQFYHLAAVKTNNTLYIFRDGIQVAAAANTQSYALAGSSDTDWAVGASQGVSSALSPAAFINGNIDDLRVTKGIARYEVGTGANAGKMVFAGTNNLALPTAELPASVTNDPSYNSVPLLLRNGGPGPLVPFDESPTPKTITTYGTASLSTTTLKYGNSALSLTGNASSYFTAPASAFVATNTEPFTIEFWVYVAASTTGFVISNYTSSGFGFGISVSSGGIGVTLVGGGEQMSGGAPVLNSWNHVVLSGTPVSPGLMLFLNGQKQGSTYTGSVSLGSATVVVTIGRLGNTATQPFNSFIDDLRITRNFARYTKKFLSPPAQLPAI